MALDSVPYLDHIVILVPHSFLATPPKWLTEAFTLYPGGQHADGLTENTLVLLPDGSYLEFIAFVPGADPEKRRAHRWGRKKEGTVIDWALSVPTPDVFKTIQNRVRDSTTTGFRYSDLVPGGRHRPDGAELRWAVAAPYRRPADGSSAKGDELVEPGELPFWCLDETPRELRVPYKEGKYAKHPSGAVGVAFISVSPPSTEEVSSLEPVYDAVLGGQTEKSPPFWGLHRLDTTTMETNGNVRLASGRGGPALSISFFTTSSDLAGRKFGGPVADGQDLEFEFVTSFDRIYPSPSAQLPAI